MFGAATPSTPLEEASLRHNTLRIKNDELRARFALIEVMWAQARLLVRPWWTTHGLAGTETTTRPIFHRFQLTGAAEGLFTGFHACGICSAAAGHSPYRVFQLGSIPVPIQGDRRKALRPSAERNLAHLGVDLQSRSLQPASRQRRKPS